MENDKVFQSKTCMVFTKTNNNLMDLLELKAPINTNVSTENNGSVVEFTPNTDKKYVPKIKIKKKVKTVRDIRLEFENYVLSYLNTDLERQKEILYKKITRGLLKDADTVNIANKILQSGQPISRTTWQMISNINPKNFTYSEQYTIWNGRKIRLSGSLGGNKLIMKNYDIKKNKGLSNKILLSKDKRLHKPHTLLRNSLSIKFKPGPLTKKTRLDSSYQKYYVGSIDLVKLPDISLEIKPVYGVSLKPLISNYLLQFREQSGMITKKWADFATSALGSVTNKNTVQNVKNNSFHFNCHYKNNQDRIMMRCDNDIFIIKQAQSHLKLNETISDNKTEDIYCIVKHVLEKMLDAVEININQDSMYTSDNIDVNLERLDTTPRKKIGVTDLEKSTDTCNNLFCKLGCVCSSLNCAYIPKTHCGRKTCMFNCKCNLKIHNNEDKLNNIISNTKIKTRSNNKENVPSNGVLDTLNRQLVVSLTPLKFENLQVWCMVHELYSCYCECKFVTRIDETIVRPNKKEVALTVAPDSFTNKTSSIIDLNINTDHNNVDAKLEFSSCRRSITGLKYCDDEINCDLNDNDNISTCARTTGFIGRKFDAQYYASRNSKIYNMEINDTNMKNKLNNLINNDNKLDFHVKEKEDTNLKIQLQTDIQSDCTVPSQIISKGNKYKLVSWLEKALRLHKHRSENNRFENTLRAPEKGHMALYPWKVISSRYKEKKNYFFVTENDPIRIFMGIDNNNPLFSNCINIDKIRFSELHKYPITVKYLLTNAGETSEKFCILHGLLKCWEILALVEKSAKKQDESVDDLNLDLAAGSFLASKSDAVKSNISTDAPRDKNVISEPTSDTCKWFLMKFENDSVELQFYNRGFFVKSSNIRKALNVARLTNKTVKLSSVTCIKDGYSFGLYAIPGILMPMLLVGPYEINESLGFEKLNDPNCLTDKQTRGMWLMVKKRENANVVHNSVLFLKRILQNTKTILNVAIPDIDEAIQPLNSDANPPNVASPSKPNVINVVKPIKIKRSNGFYHIDADGNFKRGSPSLKTDNRSDHVDTLKLADNSLSVGVNSTNKVSIEEGMCILKPEEINRRLERNIISFDGKSSNEENKNEHSPNTAINTDKAISEVLIISDDEDAPVQLDWRTVWIECEIPNVGCLPGRKNNKEELSFDFPFFKSSNFYPENEAFAKINDIMKRNFYVSESLEIKWRVVEKENDLKCKHVLEKGDFKNDYVLTSKGLCQTNNFVRLNKVQIERATQVLGDILKTTNEFFMSPMHIIYKARETINDLKTQELNYLVLKDNLKKYIEEKKNKIITLKSTLPTHT